MDITSQEALRFLDLLPDYEKTTRYSYEQDLRLDRVRALLDRLGNPQEAFDSVHIAGTRGKGSVAAMVYSVLKAAGLSVGLYTSPHLVNRRERIRYSQDHREELIEEEELAACVQRIQPHLDELLREKGWEFTYFELMTALAFCFFREKQVSHAVLEVGMGGRLDATNVVTPLVSVITPISYDHTDKLGKTLAEIAREKAGILKEGIPAVIAPQPEEALSVIRRIAKERRTPLIEVRSDYEWGGKDRHLSGQRFWVKPLRSEYRDLYVPLLGNHQIENAVVCLAVCERLKERGLQISPSGIQKGLAQVQWPGRFQILSENPFLVVDGAQNGASAEALRQTLLQIFPGRPYYLVVGVSSDKDSEAICRTLCPLAKEVIVTRSQSVRALLPEQLAKVARRYSENVQAAPSLPAALRLARADASKDAVIVVTGSLYLVGEALSQCGVGSAECGK